MNYRNQYSANPNYCKSCNKILSFDKRNYVYCSEQCRTDSYNSTALQTYRRKCAFKFALNSFPDEFDFTLIEKYGWYSPSNKKNNLNGVSRDHMYSVREGFDNDIDPKILAHPANCKLMRHNDNVSKSSSSSITLDELLRRIDTWNKKYS